MTAETVLTPGQARAYYDRFGKKQDTQGFYEDPPLDDLIAYAAFGQAGSVFEFGCGTGKLAERLFRDHLPARSTYLGCDVSPVMADLAVQRLGPFADRARIVRSEGEVRFPLPENSVDRVVSTYVLDIFSKEAVARFFAEAWRVLVPGGRLCLAGLTKGDTWPSRAIATLWTAVFRLRPALVGGCRPVSLDAHVDGLRWERLHHAVLKPFAIPSEVLVLKRCRETS